MSLGPPFDDSGLQLQRLVGACVVLLFAGAIAFVLFLSGRTLGRGITLYVEMTATGALHSGGKVRLAGREIGEIRREAWSKSGVTFEAFIVRDGAAQIHANSELFVATPSVLGEASLEVGPPRDGAQPGALVKDGDHVRGTDPPDLDRFFVRTEASLREALVLLRESRPELDELLEASDQLIATVAALPTDRGQLRRILDQGMVAFETGRALADALREAGGWPRVLKLAGELRWIIERAVPELRNLSGKLDLAMSRLEELRAFMSAERREQALTAVAGLRRATALGLRIVDDVLALQSKLESGRGSVGAFLQDREIFDDLHETHRIIKSQPLRFLLKTLKPDDKVTP
jgi:hypothetical protein